MKKGHGFPQPNGTVPYEVKKSDTLVSIAAHYHISVGLLKKINRLMSETIFPGQVLYVPGPDYATLNAIASGPSIEKLSGDHKSSAPVAMKASSTESHSPDFHFKHFELSTSPIKSIPGHAERQSIPVTEPVTLPRALSEEEVKKIDEECDQRFVKMEAKYIEPGDEEVLGILLVTPDAFVFDADDTHPLVCKNGREAYQLVTPILNISLITVYHGTTTLKFGRCSDDETGIKIQSDANDNGNKTISNSTKEKTNQTGVERDENGTNSLIIGYSLKHESIDSPVMKDDDLGEGSTSSGCDAKLLKEMVKKDASIAVKDTVYNSQSAESDQLADIGLNLKEIVITTDDALQCGDSKASKNFIKDSNNKEGTEYQCRGEETTTSSSDGTLKNLFQETATSQLLMTTKLVCSQDKAESPISTDLMQTPFIVFLFIKIDRSVDAIKGFYSESPPTSVLRGPAKSEYWFIIPCDKVNLLYAFFAHWLSEDGSAGFVVTNTDSSVEYKKYNSSDGQKLVCEIVKDWELMSSVEYKRLKSVEEIKQLPLPELSESSSIMGTSHIAVLIYHLPAIAEGSTWKLVYSSSKHGFSLNTLYRKMINVDSPVFLIIQDVNDQVFGALLSCALKMSDHFYGSGESYLFTFYPEFKKFGWTGLNSFFIKGNKDSLAIGAGEGSNGIWLDGNLYHGRTQQCQTFENELLTISQDFTIKCLETWCFA